MCIPCQIRRKNTFQSPESFFLMLVVQSLEQQFCSEFPPASDPRGCCFSFSSVEEGGTWWWGVEGHHAFPFLDDSLRKLCMAEHDGFTRTCFEKEAGAEQMSEEIFLRHSLQDREWKLEKSFWMRLFFCVFNLLGARKHFFISKVFGFK